MSRATFTITSNGTGSAGGDESFVFVEQDAPQDSEHKPFIIGISHAPEVIKSGEILFNASWTVSLKDEQLATGATYWGNLLRRVPHWRGRDAVIRWNDAEQDINLVIDKVTRKRGSVEFTLTSPLRDVLNQKPATFDRVIKLTQPLTATGGDLVVNNSLMFSSGVIRIDDELMTVTVPPGRSPGTRTSYEAAWIARGGIGLNPTIEAHATGAQVKRVIRISGTLSEVIRTFLRDEMGLAEYIDEQSFADAAAWFRPLTLDGYIVDEGKTADDILSEMLRLGSAALVWDEFTGRIKLISQVVWARTDKFKTIDDDVLLGEAVDSWTASEQTQSQVTRCAVQYGNGHAVSPQFSSELAVDADAESDREYGLKQSKEIKTTLINHTDQTTAASSARIAARRIVEQFRDPPLRIEGLKLHGAAGRDIKTGDVAIISLPEFGQSANGTAEAQACLVESAQRDILNSITTLRLARFKNYQPDFVPNLIIINYALPAADIANLFRVSAGDPAIEGTIRVIDGGIVYGTGASVPAFRSGDLPAGSNIRIEAIGGGIITGASGNGGANGVLPGSGGDAFHITAGNILATCDSQSRIAPGGTGGAEGGSGAPGTASQIARTGSAGGFGGAGEGWNATAGRYYNRGQNGQDGQDGRLSHQNNINPQNGAGGAGGGLITERYYSPGESGEFGVFPGEWLTRTVEREAGDGTDSTSSLDGGGGGGGGRGGNAGERGKTGGSGGDSGSVQGSASQAVTAEGGKLARVSAGATFSYHQGHDCITGEVVGGSVEPLQPPVVTVNAAGSRADWRTPQQPGLTIETVIERQLANSDILETVSALASSSFTNTSTEARSYRIRATAPGRVPSEWVPFSLLPVVASTLAAPVITLSNNDTTANFTVPQTASNSINYYFQREGVQSSWITHVRFRQSGSFNNETGAPQKFRVRAEDSSGVQHPSSWVEFTLQSIFYGRLVVSSASLTIGEGDIGTVGVSLSEQPAGQVIVRRNERQVAQNLVNNKLQFLTDELIYTPQNWNTQQFVRFRAVQDSDTSDDSTRVEITASGGGYGDAANVIVKITDDDSPALVLSGSTLGIMEGGSESFTVRLQTQPSANVTVNLNTGDSDVTLDLTSLTFTPVNWNDTQTVTASAAHDPDHIPLNTTITLAASGASEYAGLGASVAVTVTDDDTPAFVLSTNGLTLTEGTAQNFSINLATQPASNVTVTLAASAGFTLGTGSATSVTRTFTSSTWNTASSVRVNHEEDADTNNETGTVTITASGGGYDSVTGTVTLTGIDDDVAANVVTSVSSVSLTEGTGTSFTVRLQQQPTKSRTVTFTSSDTGAFTVSPSSITFTTSNWNSNRNVSVNAVQDSDTSNETGTISIGGSSVVAKTIAVNISDDDSLVDVQLSATGLALIEQGSGAFSARLSADPGQTVTLPVTSSNPDVTVSPTSLTFTHGSNGNYGTYQTVTVTAGSDADAQDDVATVRVAGSGVNGRSISISVTDDDRTPAIVLTPSSLSLVESASANIAVRLASRPSATVTLTLSGGAGQGWSASHPTMTFTPAAWNTPQAVTVSANSDGAGNTVPLRLSASGGDYEGVANSLPITVTATPEIVFSTASATVTEEGFVDASVRLSSQPSADVTLTFTSSNSDVAVDTDTATAGNQTTLVFTSANWSSSRSFRMRAAADADRSNETATIRATASGASEYSGLTKALALTVLDNDTRQLTLSTSSLALTEGNSATFTVRPTTQPYRNSTLTIASLDPGAVSTSPEVHTFTRSNWSPVTVTVSALQDSDTLDETVTVRLSGDDFTTSNFTVTVTDDDSGVTNIPLVLSRAGIEMDEGTSETFTAALMQNPNEARTVTIASDNSDVTVTPSTLNFSASTWNTAQTVTVTAATDAERSDESATLSLTGSGIETASIRVNVRDANRLIVSADSVSFTEGDVDGALVTVRLGQLPSGTVTVAVAENTNPDITVSPANLTYTTANWNIDQQFRIRARKDADAVTDAGLVRLTASGGAYDGKTGQVAVNVVDNDTPSKILLSKSEMVFNEGGSDTFTVHLGEQPNTTTLTIPVASDNSRITFNPGNVVFTQSDWQTPQTITVSSTQDSDQFNETGVVSLSVTSLISNYDGESAGIDVTVLDDDLPDIYLSQDAFTLIEGNSGTLTVQLTAPATNSTDTVVTVIPNNASATVDTGSTNDDDVAILTFPASGRTSQTVTITAAEDLNSTDDTVRIRFTANGGGNYTDVVKDFTLTAVDNDVALLDVDNSVQVTNEGESVTFRVRMTQPVFGQVLLSGASAPVDLSALASARNQSVAQLQASVIRDISDTIDELGGNLESVFDDIIHEGDNFATAMQILAGAVDKGSHILFSDTPANPLGIAGHRPGSNTPEPSSITFPIYVATGSGTVNKTFLAFNSGNWNGWQDVTVSIPTDSDSSNSLTVVAIAANTVETMAAVARDDDAKAIQTSVDSLTINEGGSATYTVRLSEAPTASVTVDLDTNIAGKITIDTNSASAGNQSSLVFTTSNWSTAQAVTVTAAQDSDSNDDTIRITHTATEGGFAGVTKTVDITVDDDDALTPSYTYNLPLTGQNQSQFPRLDVPIGSTGAVVAIVLTGSPGSTRTYTAFDIANYTFTPIGSALTYTTSNFGTASAHLYRLTTSHTTTGNDQAVAGIRTDSSHYLAINARRVSG